ncbi:seryl-tRNA synthetase [Actinokineospora baliensis]|uniref:serine--tRNA ligase n=1 Tax=Actinokineospora baliensis TaxID=547056 RepID=UPI0019574376|nr:serine--tRNA ligase [Actinokineospora baliensis]MBM7771203.1 seryl-tRNA synthetase [Actinokineospora baliensis]
MHDPRVLLDPSTDAVRKLARRGFQLDLARLSELVQRRSALIQQLDQERGDAKKVAQEVKAAASRREDTTALVERARALKVAIADGEREHRQVEEDLHGFLLDVPNLPEDRCPDGNSDEFAVEVRTWGTPQAFDFPPLDHVDLGERFGIFDFARGVKLSGPRFTVIKGVGAELERAVAQLFLSIHTKRHGYTEFSLPALLNRESLTGTGQLPKFEEDLFKTGVGDRELFLTPTAEVPLTNLHANEILPFESLPLAYTAWTPCFRSEAGSYGRDTRGLIRQHQFSKVEMVRFCDPDQSSQELEAMVGHAEACLRELGLAYRVVALAAGDISFASQFTYDIEVWVPSQNTYREISSCSDCSTYQARRAGIRTKTKDGKKGIPATLNGSGLPIGRTIVALLEQGQQADGSVVLPSSLGQYLGYTKINPDGTTG